MATGVTPPKASRELYVNFSAPVNPKTAQALLAEITKQIDQGAKKVHLLISTPGGSVNVGIELYNRLRAMPVELTSHNMGHVDSIGNVVFLAADTRYSCPHARFMFHGVGLDFAAGARLEEKQLAEHLAAIRQDQALISGIITARSQIRTDEVDSLFLRAGFLDAETAKAKGLVSEIREAKIPEGAPVLQFVFEG